MRRLFFAAAAALLFATSPAMAGEWELLGEKRVGFGQDLDRVQVTAREGRFTKVKFRVEQSGIVLDWIKLHFRNGETKQFNPPQPLRLQAGSESRAFDLPGEKRIIQAISFKYQTPLRQAPRGKAHVKVAGKH